MNRTSHSFANHKPTAIALAVGIAVSNLALANPEGGTVVGGSASIIAESATKLGIQQHSDRAIIDWQRFDIQSNEHTQIYQPSSSAVILNRVSGSDDPSKIMGQLSANGRVFISNPNGVLFGQNARVDVAALVATTHDIRNSDFMAGKFDFTIPGNPDASVINQGDITVADRGLVGFVAPGVQNDGVIVARLGKVQMASANGFTVDLYGDQLIQLLVEDQVAAQYALDVQGNRMESLVGNSGTIQADGGYVLLTANAARNLVSKVVNSSGIIEARSVREENGEIILDGGSSGEVHLSGTLDVSGKSSGEAGGSVKILGEKVALLDDATVDASGDAGGGEVLVGGDYLGQGDTPTAEHTFIAQGVTLSADALTRGNGGKLIAWADHTTHTYGTFSARGGSQGGDGGFIETSGKKYLHTESRVDASAPLGQSGTWLLDPMNITITSGGSNYVNMTHVANTTHWSRGLEDKYPATAVGATISDSYISSVLDAGTNIKIVTSNSGGESGDITVEGDILKSAGGNAHLALSGYRDVIMASGGSITSTSGVLDLYVNPGRDPVNFNLGGNINLNGGSYKVGSYFTTGTREQTDQHESRLYRGGNYGVQHVYMPSHSPLPGYSMPFSELRPRFGFDPVPKMKRMTNANNPRYQLWSRMPPYKRNEFLRENAGYARWVEENLMLQEEPKYQSWLRKSDYSAYSNQPRFREWVKRVGVRVDEWLAGKKGYGQFASRQEVAEWEARRDAHNQRQNTKYPRRSSGRNPVNNNVSRRDQGQEAREADYQKLVEMNRRAAEERERPRIVKQEKIRLKEQSKRESESQQQEENENKKEALNKVKEPPATEVDYRSVGEHFLSPEISDQLSDISVSGLGFLSSSGYTVANDVVVQSVKDYVKESALADLKEINRTGSSVESIRVGRDIVGKRVAEFGKYVKVLDSANALSTGVSVVHNTKDYFDQLEQLRNEVNTENFARASAAGAGLITALTGVPNAAKYVMLGGSKALSFSNTALKSGGVSVRVAALAASLADKSKSMVSKGGGAALGKANIYLASAQAGIELGALLSDKFPNENSVINITKNIASNADRSIRKYNQHKNELDQFLKFTAKESGAINYEGNIQAVTGMINKMKEALVDAQESSKRAISAYLITHKIQPNPKGDLYS